MSYNRLTPLHSKVLFMVQIGSTEDHGLNTHCDGLPASGESVKWSILTLLKSSVSLDGFNNGNDTLEKVFHHGT